MALARHDEGFASIKQALVQGRQNIKYLSAQTGTGSLRLVSDAVVRNLDEPIPDALTQPKAEPKRAGKQRPATASSVLSRSFGSPGAALTGPASSPRGRDTGSNALDVRNGNSGSGPGTGRPLFAVPVAKTEKPKKLNRDDTAVLAWEIANKSSRRISAALARVGLEPPMPTIDFKGNVTVYKQRMPNVFEDLPRVSGGAHGLSSFTTDKTGPTEAVEVPKLRPASVFDVGDMGNPQIVQLAVNTRRHDPDGLVRLGPNGNAAPPPAETIISAEEMAAAAMRAKQKVKPSGLQGIVTVAASASSVASKEQQHRMERRRSSADPAAAAAASAPAPPPIVPPPLSDQLVDPGHIPLVATMAVAATHANPVYRVVGRLKTASSSSRKKGAEHVAGALVSTDPTGAGQDANRREDDNDDGADPEAIESIQQMAYASVGLVVPERYVPGKGVAALIQHQMVAATAAAAQVDLIATKRLAIEMAHLESKIGDGHNSLSSLIRPALASNGLVPQHLCSGSAAVLAASAAASSHAASDALGNVTNSSINGRVTAAAVAGGAGGRGSRPSSASAYQSTSQQSAGGGGSGGGSASNGGGRPGTASTPSSASAAATAASGSLRLQKGQTDTAGSPPQLASSASASAVPRSGMAVSSSAPSIPSAAVAHPAPPPRSALASTTATPKAGGATAASQLVAGASSSTGVAAAGAAASSVVRFAEGTKGGTGSVAASGRSGGFQQQLQMQPPFITTSGLGVSLGPFSAATAGSARSTGDYFMGQTPKMSPFTSPTAQPFASPSMTSAMGSPLGGAGSSVGLQSPASSSIASPSSMFSPSQQQKQLQPQQKQQQLQQQQQEQQRHRHDNQTDSEDDEYDEELEAERIAEQQLRDPKLNPFKLPRSEFERVQALPRPGSAAAAAMAITMKAAAVADGGGSGAGADAVVARVTPSGLVRIGAAGAHTGKQSSASGHQSSTAGVAVGGGSGGGGGGVRRVSNGNGWTAASSSASNSSSALVLDPSQAASLAELQHIAHPSVSTALAAMFRHTDIRRKHFAEVRERLQGIRRNAAQNACDAVAAYTYRLGQVRSHRYNAVADVMDLKGQQQQQHEDQTKEHSPGDPNSNRHNGTQHPQSMINTGSADESLTAMRLVTAREGYLDEADNLDLLQTAVAATSEGKPAGISGIERSFLVHLRAAALSSAPINKAFVWKLLENAHVGALSCSASQLLLPEDIQHVLEQQALMGKAINRSKSGGGGGGDGGVGAGWEVEPPPDSALEAFLDKKKQSRSKVLGVSALGVNAKQRRRSSIGSNFALGMLNGSQSLGFMAKPSSTATAAGGGSGTNSAVGSRRPSIHGPASAIASRRNSFANAGAGGAGCDGPSAAAAALGSSAQSMQAPQQLPSSSLLAAQPVALSWHSQHQQHQYQVSQVGAHAHLRPSSASATLLPLPTSSSPPLPSSTASSTPLFKLDLRLVPASPIRVTQQNSNTGSGNGGSDSNLGHNSAHAFTSAAAGSTKAFDDQLLAGIEFTAVDSGRLGYHGASAGSASVGDDVGVVAAATASSSSSPGHFSSPIIRRLSLSIQQANAAAFLQSQSLQQQQARPGSATVTASSSSAWARNTGRPASAAPGTSNHGTALSYTATERNGAGGGGGGSAGVGTRPASAKAVVVFGQHARALGHSSTAPACPGSARAPGSLTSGTASLPSPEATPSPSSSSSASASASSAPAAAAGTGSASMEPLATIPSKLLTAAEKAARVARRAWPVVLEAPISLFLAYVGISDAEYWSWLEDHDLRPPNPESRAAYGALQRSQFDRCSAPYAALLSGSLSEIRETALERAVADGRGCSEPDVSRRH